MFVACLGPVRGEFGMATDHLRTVRLSRHLVIAGAFLLLFVVPLSVWAQDEQSITTLRQMGKAFASIAEKASPAVVGVQVEKTVKASDSSQMREWSFGDPFNPFDDDFFKYFFQQPNSPRRYRQQQQPKQIAQGSGFIITRDGYILTNNHLAGEADKVTVKFAGGEKFTAKVIGADPESDVAVIKIDKDNLPYLELADSDKLEVGEWVIAIGNPFGLTHTVTAGIVSAKGRSGIGVAKYEDFIQTDAAINFGNSGGPLLNLDGKVVGMNTAIIGPGGNIGIGMAIPINLANFVYKQLIDTGKVVHGFLGVTIQDLEPDMAKSFGLEGTKGVLVADVTKDSAADKAGFKHGDVVVEFGGQPVESANDFRNRVGMQKPGSKVEVVVLRDGKRRKLDAELDNWPEGGVAARGERSGGTSEKLGISVQSLTDELAQRLGYEGLSGVVVTDVEAGSLAAEAGLRNGSLIMEVNRKPIHNVKEFNEAIKQASEEGKVLLRVKDEDYTRFIILSLSDR
jgi:serine protease Do